ncbi:unnamed protein product [Calypogeia fissa]
MGVRTSGAGGVKQFYILRCSHGSERTATHDDIRDVLAAIARDAGYHVSTEQTHVLPAVDGIPDRRRADIVFLRAGVRALANVVVVDPMGASMVASAAHNRGHAAFHTAQLKEEAYAVRHSRDLFYPFAVEVFGALHSAPGPVPSVHNGPLRGVAAVPPGLGGYGFS